MVLGKLGKYMQKNETRPPSYTTYKNKLKNRLKTSMLRPQTIKITEENRQQNLGRCSQQDFIVYISPGNKRKINKWDYIKLKSFCTAKEVINKIKRQPTQWGNIYTDTSDKRLIS